MTGIGVDLETTDRFKDLRASTHARFLNRIYTTREIGSSFRHSQPWKELARRFAGKEAVFKALCGSGCRGVSLKDIEIHFLRSGAAVLLKGRRLAGARAELTLSTTGRFVLAFALAKARSR